MNASGPNTQMLGQLLYGKYAVAVEIASAILLSAIIAAVVLVFRGPQRRLVQDIPQQIAAQREARIRLIDLPRQGESP